MELITILGSAAAFCTTVCNVPQVIKIIRTRETKGVSALTYTVLLIGLVLWVIYGWIQKDWPVTIANALSALICATVLTLKLLPKRAVEQIHEKTT